MGPVIRISRLVALVIGVLAVLSACGTPPARYVGTRPLRPPVSFPDAVYPVAVAPHSGTSIEGDCANPAGVVPRPRAVPATFTRLLNEAFHADSLQRQLVDFDQATWPDEVADWATPPRSTAKLNYVASDLQIHPGWTGTSIFEQLIANACGSSVLQGTWIVSGCYPGKVFASCDPGVTETYGVIERDNTWLIWYMAAGYQAP